MSPGFWSVFREACSCSLSDLQHASSTGLRLCNTLTMCVCSWNLGPAHIISFSTEVYFYLEFGLELLFKQYEWLEKDLEVNDHSKLHLLTMAERSLLFPHLLSASLSIALILHSHKVTEQFHLICLHYINTNNFTPFVFFF